jgi:hypothetical protein
MTLTVFPRSARQLRSGGSHVGLPRLGLHPDEPVRVRARQEIRRTLDREGRSRGRFFDVEMTHCCGCSMRVERQSGLRTKKGES